MKKIAIILLLLPYMTAFADINLALLSAAVYGDHVSVEQLLKDPFINVNYQTLGSKRTALIAAAKNGHVKCVGALLAHKDIDPNLKSLIGPPLSFAIQFYSRSPSNYAECINLLLAHPKIDPDVVRYDKMTPLILSVVFNNISVLKRLAPITKNINALDDNDQSALCSAVYKNNIEAIKILIAYGADLHVGSPSAYDLTSRAEYAHLREVIETLQQAALKAALGTHPVQFVRNREIGRAQLSHKKPATSASHMPATARSAEPASGAMAPWPCNRPRA